MPNHPPTTCDSNQAMLCDNRLKRIEDTVNLIDKAIRGNGVPGLKEEVRVLQAREAARSRLFWIVVGTAVAQVATLGVAALFYVHAALVR
jgi:hypothetical protein